MRYAITSLIAANAVAIPLNSDFFEFAQYVSQYGKHYGTTEEFDFRFNVY